MMKQPFTKFGVTTLFSLLCSAFLHAQVVTDERMFSFEEPQIPDCITATHSRLSVSDLHYKDGKHSLEWTFEPGGILELKKDLKFEKKDPTGKDLYLSAFIVWVYNEVPQDATIEFQFLKDGKRCTSFPFGINFSGWRAAWVCYERDMQGTPEEGMNELRIIAPNSKGSLFIDHLITATKVDARQQTADLQVPFVNAGTTNHWLVVYQHSLLKPDIELTPVDDKQRAEMQLLEKRFRDMIYTKGKTTDKEVETIRKKYDFYQITYKNGQVSGVPIYMVRASEAYERIIPNWDKDMLTKMGVEMRAYFDLMKRIAVAYNNAANPVIREEMKKKFLAMYDHITDQGVAYGSCWGNIHHYGYSVRGLYLAYFLMKDVLRETGKLQEAERTLRWYAITNEVYPKPEVNGIDMDSFNTQTTGRIASILMMEDTPEKLQYLRSFSRWIDFGCRPALGLSGSFKVDGGAFHHRNNYPAYAVGGLDGATNMIYLFSRTEFAVSELAHETVKNVLLTASRDGRPKEILETPIIVLIFCSVNLRITSKSTAALSGPVLIVSASGSIIMLRFSIPHSAARAIIFSATANLPAAVAGMPSSSNARPTTTAPYFFTSGSTFASDSSLPLTEFNSGLPLYKRRARSIVS